MIILHLSNFSFINCKMEWDCQRKPQCLDLIHSFICWYKAQILVQLILKSMEKKNATSTFWSHSPVVTLNMWHMQNICGVDAATLYLCCGKWTWLHHAWGQSMSYTYLLSNTLKIQDKPVVPLVLLHSNGTEDLRGQTYCNLRRLQQIEKYCKDTQNTAEVE